MNKLFYTLIYLCVFFKISNLKRYTFIFLVDKMKLYADPLFCSKKCTFIKKEEKDMKKEFETPTIEIIYFDENINLGPQSDWSDSNVDMGGWI